MVDLVDRVQADLAALALGRVGLMLGRVGLMGPVPQLAHLVHLTGSRVTANRVKLAQTPVNPPVNPQLLAPKLNSPG